MSGSREHTQLSDQLNAFLDGELDERWRASVEAHLAACKVCRRDLKELRATRTALRALAPRRAPRPLTIEVPAPAQPALLPLERQAGRVAALGWAWRLGSLGTAACLLIAWLVSGLAPTGSQSAASGRPEAATSRESLSMPQADTSASQRVASQPVAATSVPEMRDPAGDVVGAAAREAARGPGSGPPPAAQTTSPAPAQSPLAARMPENAQSARGASTIRPPAGSAATAPLASTVWLALASIFAVAGALAFGLERRSQRRRAT